jgi:hypothetical protein
VKYDRRLSTGPHIKALLAAVRQRASVVSRLANHLPRGEYLRQLSYGLVVGKFSRALAAVARPRLEQEDNASVVWSGIQVALNDVARSITGTWRRNHVRIEDLLAQAGLESANRMVVKAIAAETWGCFHSDDGRDGSRNHVGRLLFSDKRTATANTTRLAKTGPQIEVPLRGGDTFIAHTANVWNRSVPLRAKQTKAAAKKAASDLASLSRFSRDPAGLDLPPAALGVFPAGRGASPAGPGAYPRERGRSPSRSWAPDETSSPSRALLLPSPRAAGVAGMKKGICFLGLREVLKT